MNELKETVMKIEKEISTIMTEIFETELSEDSKQVAVYIAGYVAKKIKKLLTCHVCNKVISNDNDIENDKYLKTLSRGGLVVPSISILELVSPIIEQVTEKNSVAFVSNTVLMKLEYRTADFSCEQHFKKSTSISVWIIINIIYNKKQKITNGGVRNEQI